VSDLLTDLASKYCLDKGTGNYPSPTFYNVPEIRYPQSFTPFYNQHLEHHRQDFKKVLEIGVLFGNSLLFWDEYFPNAKIHGFDIDLSRVLECAKNFPMMIGDQSERSDLKRFISVYGDSFDLIIEDGGHKMDQQQISFGYLFEKVKPGGYFILEDIHTSLSANTESWGILPDLSNSTLLMLEKYRETGKINSIHMLAEEIEYLESNIESCEIYYTQSSGRVNPSVTSIIKKVESNEPCIFYSL